MPDNDPGSQTNGAIAEARARIDATDQEYDEQASEILSDINAQAEQRHAAAGQHQRDKATLWEEIFAEQQARFDEIDAIRAGDEDREDEH